MMCVDIYKEQSCYYLKLLRANISWCIGFYYGLQMFVEKYHQFRIDNSD